MKTKIPPVFHLWEPHLQQRERNTADVIKMICIEKTNNMYVKILKVHVTSQSEPVY